ncbi:MAG: ribonuclease HI family protein [Elusimicrobiales bacterium]|nr:ribonuclease HI family protein [Elusimicrobiales bacterium]
MSQQSERKILNFKNLIIYIDGASKGNPGEGACGAIFMNDKNEIIAEEGRVLGTCTNNFAEYSSLHLALSVAKRYNAKKLEIYSDSQLLVKQFNGEYKIKDPKLKELLSIIKKEASEFNEVKLNYIPRSKNKVADKFVNKLLEAKKLKKSDRKKLQKERESRFKQDDLF